MAQKRPGIFERLMDFFALPLFLIFTIGMITIHPLLYIIPVVSAVAFLGYHGIKDDIHF
jgi:hypothetical protein